MAQTRVSHISVGGVVTSITITDAGIGYTNTPTIRITAPPAAAVSPEVQSVMRVDAASLAPYNNYQIQFKPALSGAWGNELEWRVVRPNGRDELAISVHHE
jgi:hypothetical protein